MPILSASIREAGYERAPVLRDISLKLNEGESVIVVGPSGSGKTTLLFSITGVLAHLLNGYVEGEVRAAGLNPLDYSDFQKLYKYVGVVLQDPERQVVMPTPLDEVITFMEALGYDYEEARKRAYEVLSALGLRDKADTHVEKLSAGQRRRLSIALSVVHDPPLLVFDEPTANLDPKGIGLVRELLASAKERGRASLVVEHKPMYFRDYADRIYYLTKLGLREVGPYDEEQAESGKFTCRGGGARAGEVVLRARGLSVGYGGIPVLEGIDLEVRRGEAVALVGPNGSGKTTLLKALAGILEPIGGEIDVRPRKVFYSPQNPDMVFVKRTVDAELRALSRETGRPLGQLIELIPWYPQVRGLSPHWLSHGQRRWLSLVIALSHAGDLLLLDEPTTGLDYRIYNQLVKLLDEARGRGSAIVMATHDPRLVGDIADRAIIIDGGRATEVDPCKAIERMIGDISA